MSRAVRDHAIAERRLVADLSEVGREDASLVGGKGANLGELVRIGLQVPSGFVVTTQAYDLAVGRAGLHDQVVAATEAEPDGRTDSASRVIHETLARTPLPPEVGDAVIAAYRELGAGPVAVRSSATAEDLPEAAFAGQQETYLNVLGEDDLLGAVRDCFASLWSERAVLYRSRQPVDRRDVKLAVVVQRMVPSEVAGVLFTAHPVTGARDEVVIDASPGLGEAVVGGLVTPDQFVVDKGALAIKERRLGRREAVVRARAGGGTEEVRPEGIGAPADPCLADAAVVDLARLGLAVEGHFGAPQDVEWAIAEGKTYVLQARPMTALPELVTWQPPARGYWMRNLRLGEWLPEAMTPLFRTWLLERLEAGYLLGMRKDLGTALPFPYASINGWYYLAAPTVSLPTILRAAVESRGRIFPFFLNALIRVSSQPELADRTVLRRLAEEWRDELLPRYRHQVEEEERRVDEAGPEQLADLINRIGLIAGEYLWSLAIVGGSAWKMEGCLARFLRQHVTDSRRADVQVMLRGLPGAKVDTPAHAVQSADWYWPYAGELGRPEAGIAAERRERLAAERQAAEGATREDLANDPALLARFDAILEVSQRYAALREAQSRDFTLGWPLLRRAALRLGASLVAQGLLDRPEDVFFLTRGELTRGELNRGELNRGELRTEERLQRVVQERRADWERQRRLVAPLSIGKPPRLMESALSDMVNAVRATRSLPEGAIVGQPASPGRATGPARIVRGPEEFDRLQPGEVLVAKATTPAWTPLFARAVAVVTDGGTLAAHASLVAREYGIPAVVGAGDATRRLRDGQIVIVDGSAGMVERVGS